MGWEKLDLLLLHWGRPSLPSLGGRRWGGDDGSMPKKSFETKRSQGAGAMKRRGRTLQSLPLRHPQICRTSGNPLMRAVKVDGKARMHHEIL